jgi:hypothetical protein
MFEDTKFFNFGIDKTPEEVTANISSKICYNETGHYVPLKYLHLSKCEAEIDSNLQARLSQRSC